MNRKPSKAAVDRRRKSAKPLGLKELAQHLGLAPATISLVMNGAAVADTIAPQTRKMILAAARQLQYRPNFFARCLRTKRSLTIGVIVSELSEGYNVNVLSGIEDYLLQEGYFYFVASHRFQQDLIDEYIELFLHRSVDGLIAVNTPWHRRLDIPVATVSSHHFIEGVTRIVVDHNQAAEIALRYLMDLGHRKIAFIKGQAFVPDTEVRWKAIAEAANRLGLPISSKLIACIEDNSPSPHLGYRITQKLLAAGEPFTALFAFNDISAMGAIRALYECGRRVPDDVSVLGFDDIESASYQTRSLSTVRQPLKEMGRLAAENVLRRAQSSEPKDSGAAEIVVAPELIERETTSVVSWARKAHESGVTVSEPKSPNSHQRAASPKTELLVKT
ncbi:MAG: LacI family DNA-binding transcriptional regulator [Candidatus Acidiferrum sp.]